jgi:hypothetical protein
MLLNRNGSVAIELCFVLPIIAAGQRFNRFAIPWFNEIQLSRHLLHQNRYRACCERRLAANRSFSCQFKKEVNVGKSLAADGRRKAKTHVVKGQGDRGDTSSGMSVTKKRAKVD